jgi:hypothetical protein
VNSEHHFGADFLLPAKEIIPETQSADCVNLGHIHTFGFLPIVLAASKIASLRLPYNFPSSLIEQCLHRTSNTEGRSMFDAEPLTDEEILLRFRKVFHREMTQGEKQAFLLLRDRPKGDRSDKES